VAEGKVDGLRVDHPDGLYDPAQYFERLKRGIAEAPRIPRTPRRRITLCGHREDSYRLGTTARRMAGRGTTGYDFANLVNGLFVDPGRPRALSEFTVTLRREQSTLTILPTVAGSLLFASLWPAN
jgi:(1->4)-alpha-D-glucan 1-alpha-D-glucosylmutase